MNRLLDAELVEKWIAEQLDACAQIYETKPHERPYCDGRHDQLIKLRDAIQCRLFDAPPPNSGVVGGLLPCPFCGVEPRKHSNGVMVQCPTIPCPMNAGWTFVEHWNQRQPSPGGWLPMEPKFIPGGIYESTTHGTVEYKGVDNYMGDVTLHFYSITHKSDLYCYAKNLSSHFALPQPKAEGENE
jgi:hypothetical protein